MHENEVNVDLCKYDPDSICCKITNMAFDCKGCPYLYKS